MVDNKRGIFKRTMQTTLKCGKVVNLVHVGQWMELANYYRGDDGNYWNKPLHRDFVNLGPKIRNMRGKTLDGQDIETLPDLSK